MPTRILYLSHNEIDDGLVRSQVLPYLRGMSARGVDARLFTFERGGGFPAGEFPVDRWSGLPARPGHGLAAKAVDLAAGTIVALWLMLRHRIQLVHARSYLPAAIAFIVGALTRRPYVFDMRGFLPDEYLEVGHWTRGDPRYRLARAAELILLRGAAGIVCPSTGAERLLRRADRYASVTGGKPITVLPSMVDLERFRPRDPRAAVPTLVYSGSIGTWYMLDEMLRVYACAQTVVPELRLRILTRGDRAIVDEAIARLGLEGMPIETRPAQFSEMPELVGEAHVAIVLVRQTPSKLAASALKIAEYLACGLPVVVNAGLGDADGLIARYGAGHVLPDFSDAELRRAGAAVAGLLGDGAARASARRLAEDEFDLRTGVERYLAMYASATTAADVAGRNVR